MALALLGLFTLAPQSARAQAGTLAGTVIANGSQRPIAGAQVAVEGQAGVGAVSDASGHFRITGVSGTTVTLNVRALGYRPETQSVSVPSTTLRFQMSERAVELNQVVVTGTAGGEQKRSLGTSVSTINAAEVTAQAPVVSVDALLNGRTPGVTVLPGTGQIGAGANIRIRGIGTFSLSSQPLIYVDGVRVNNDVGSGLSVQAFSSGIVSRLNDFDPSEIESVEVLKGPAAATLYGTEAARGVVNIITKKGAAGENRYSFQAQGGTNWFQDAAGRIGTSYCVLLSPTNCVNSNAQAGPLLGLNIVKQEDARGTPIFQTGKNQNYSGNVSGGTALFRYFASGQYMDNQGADITNARQQKSVRTNLNITPNAKTDIATSFGYIHSRTLLSCEAGCGGAMWQSMYSNPANLAQFCPAGDVGCTYVRGFQSAPPESDRALHDEQGLNRLTASATVNFRPWQWMTHRFAIGTDVNMENNPEWVPYLTNDTLAYFWGATAKGYRFNWQHQAVNNTYDYTGGINLNPLATVSSKTSFGMQYYTRNDQFIQGEGDYFPAPGLQTISAAGTKIGLQDGWSANNTFGYYGQEQVGWKDRLFLTGAVRVDNNSSFGKQVKWATYPKASLSYVASEEPALRDKLPQFINSLRFRAAYGASGQQPSLNTALQTLQPVAGPGGQGILTPNTLGNSNLKPERVIGTELGFESGMFNDRIGVDFTYYHDDSKDAILSRGVAPSSGFGVNNQFFNAGEIVKQGVELGLKAQVIDRQSFGWDLNFTLGTHSSKIQRLNGTDTTIDLGSVSHRIGYAPFDYFSYKVLSATYDPATRRAINPTCDNGKGQAMPCYSATGVLQAPKVFLGHLIPTSEGSLTSTIRFLKNFRLYGMFDYATDFKRLDNNLRIRCQIFFTCAEYLQPDKADPARLAQMQSGGPLRNFVINNANYLKFRELSLSWDAPDRLAKRVGARQLGLTVAGRNLHIWSPYTGLDPESYFVSNSPSFTDQAELPQLTSLLFTVRLSY